MSSKLVNQYHLRELLALYGASEWNQQDEMLVRRIAALYEQTGDLQNALEWYGYACALTKNRDAGLKQKVIEIELKILDASILEFRSWLENYGSAEGAGEVRRQLKELKARRVKIQLPEKEKPEDRINWN